MANTQALAQAAPDRQAAPADDLLRTLNLKARETPMPAFVEKTHPDDSRIDYIPVGKPHPERPVRVMTPAEVAATEADLDKARMAQQRRAGLKPVPVPDKPRKTGPKRAGASIR